VESPYTPADRDRQRLRPGRRGPEGATPTPDPAGPPRVRVDPRIASTPAEVPGSRDAPRVRRGGPGGAERAAAAGRGDDGGRGRVTGGPAARVAFALVALGLGAGCPGERGPASQPEAPDPDPAEEAAQTREADTGAPVADAEAPPEGTEGMRPEERPAEIWTGAVDLPGGAGRLDLSVRLEDGGDGARRGTISIPVQGVADAPLSAITDDGEALHFTFEVPGAPARFELTRDGAEARGELAQGGHRMPLSLRLAAPGEDVAVGPPRPQTPEPPYPYQERHATWPVPEDGVTLAGTLTLPEGEGPHPAVVLITGSGPQDRDETIFGHKPFLVLADHLSRRGVAVLRFDDRGVGESTGDAAAVTLASNTRDARASLTWLRSQPGIDPARVGLLGHSEGALHAARVAADAPEEVAFVIALAGHGVPGDALLVAQLEAILGAEGAEQDTIAEAARAQRAVLDAMLAGGEVDALRALIAPHVEAQLAAAAGDEPVNEEARRAAVEAQLAAVTSAWFQDFVRTDPAEVWSRVRCPVLALFGALDTQVPAEANRAALADALAKGGNQEVTATVLAGLNHLFQPATTGGLSEYATIEITLAAEALHAVATWLEGVTAR